MARSIDAVVFDMDVVLFDSEPLMQAAAIEMFRRRHGVELTPAAFRPFLGAGDDAFIAGAGRSAGITVDLAVDKPATYATYLELARDLQPTAGLHAFLGRLGAAGIRLALATGADRARVDVNLGAIGLAEATFEVVVTAEDVTRKKPDPETFLRATAGLGLPAPRCLVVEDAVHGIHAALAAGCPAVGVTSTLPADALLDAGAFATMADFTAVPPAVAELLGLS